MGRPAKPRDPSIVEVRLDFAITTFVDHLISRKAAPGTVASKRTTLSVLQEQMGGGFLVWKLTHREMSVVQDRAIHGETIEEAAEHGRFGRAVRTGRNTKQGIGQTRATLEQFIKFCTTHKPWMPVGVYVPEPVFHSKKETAVVEEKPMLVIAHEQWPAMLDLAEKFHLRARVAVALGLYLGRRASEVIHLQWKHIDWDRGILHVWDVKNGRALMMPLHPEIRAELTRWRDWTEEHYGDIDPEWYVVPAKLQARDMKGVGRQLKVKKYPDLWPVNPAKKSRVSSVLRETRRVLSLLGYDTNEGTGTHTWRRSAAVFMSETYGILAAQALLGHKLVTTTQRYTRNSDGKKTLWAALMPGHTPPGGFGLENLETPEKQFGHLDVTSTEKYANVIPIRKSA